MSDPDDELADVRALLPGEELRALESLHDTERTSVLRVRATDADGGHRGLIVKRVYDPAAWRRESAALASVPGAVRVPAVIAAAPGVLVLEDLGSGPSVADALLGDDPAEASEAVLGWAEALAEVHCATRGTLETFRAELARAEAALAEGQPATEPTLISEVEADADAVAATDVPDTDAWLPERIREAERLLDRQCGALGVTIPAGALAEFTGLAGRLGATGAAAGTAALTPADACPDNNVRIGDRVVLIDFGGAQWTHLAWDVAYLLVPWPTCWCAWRIPADVRAAALERYRAVAAQAFPEVADDAFLRDVEAAAVGWCMLSAAFTLDHALGPEPELDQQIELTRPSPRRRALVMNRLRRAAGYGELPALAELADGLSTELQRRWGDVPLDVAPAFRAGR